MGEITGARVCVTRTVAWGETDAAGHNHFSAAFRWLEETEHALYQCLGFDIEMTDRLYRILDTAFSAVIKRSKERKISTRTAAMAIGVERVLDAKRDRGLFP